LFPDSILMKMKNHHALLTVAKNAESSYIKLTSIGRTIQQDKFLLLN